MKLATMVRSLSLLLLFHSLIAFSSQLGDCLTSTLETAGKVGTRGRATAEALPGKHRGRVADVKPADIALGLGDGEGNTNLRQFAETVKARVWQDWGRSDQGFARVSVHEAVQATFYDTITLMKQGIENAVEYGGRIHVDLTGVDVERALKTRLEPTLVRPDGATNYELSLIRTILDYWNHTDFYIKRNGNYVKLTDAELKEMGLAYVSPPRGLKSHIEAEVSHQLSARPEANDPRLAEFWQGSRVKPEVPGFLASAPFLFERYVDDRRLTDALVYYFESGQTTKEAIAVAKAIRTGALKLSFWDDRAADSNTVSVPAEYVTFTDLASNVLLKGMRRLTAREKLTQQPTERNSRTYNLIENKIVPYAAAIRFREVKGVPNQFGHRALHSVLHPDDQDLYVRGWEYMAHPDRFVNAVAMGDSLRSMDFRSNDGSKDRMVREARQIFSESAVEGSNH